MLARHVSDLIGPSSGAFCTICIRRLWYVVIRVLLDTSSRNGWTCRVVRTVVPHTKVCEYSSYKTLLMMDRWGPKHVELTKSAECNLLTKTTLCILLDYICILQDDIRSLQCQVFYVLLQRRDEVKQVISEDTKQLSQTFVTSKSLYPTSISRLPYSIQNM